MARLSDNLNELAADSDFRVAMRRFLEHFGARRIMAYGRMDEDMLPSGKSRSELLDTIRYKLNQCDPKHTLLIIDPFLFPQRPDAAHAADLVELIKPFVQKCSKMVIVTTSNHNASLKAAIEAEIRTINPALLLSFKYADDIHDRWWIADDKRGILVGTSFGGIGKKYALTDFIGEEDAQSISDMVKALP